MIDWLKRNWLKILIGFGILVLIYSGLDSIVTRITYKKQIKEKDLNISELSQEIRESEKREDSWMKSSQKNYALAIEKEKKLRQKDREIMKKIAEKRELKKKIREMPATQVVVRTIEIIQCAEVQQQAQGIVFSLSCAKENLTVLEGSFSLKREVDDWKGQYTTCLGEVSDLKNVIVAKDGVIAERGVQLGKKDGAIKEWEGKFILSENRGKRSWWKGIKTGGTVGGIAGFLLGFFLGGK